MQNIDGISGNQCLAARNGQVRRVKPIRAILPTGKMCEALHHSKRMEKKLTLGRSHIWDRQKGETFFHHLSRMWKVITAKGRFTSGQHIERLVSFGFLLILKILLKMKQAIEAKIAPAKYRYVFL